jgi:hypothetical protein
MAVAAAAIAALVLTGCPATPQPPPGDTAPVVESVSVEPQTASAGETVEIVVVVRDDTRVTATRIDAVVSPRGHEVSRWDGYGSPPVCTQQFDQGEDVTTATITMTCQVPSPTIDGTWRVLLRIADGTAAGDSFALRTSAQIPFQVQGGPQDSGAPRLLGWSTTPTQVRQDTPFTLTMRIQDESLPLREPFVGESFFFVKPFVNTSLIGCADPVMTPVSADEVLATFDCGGGPRTEAGVHHGTFDVVDALGQPDGFYLQIDVDYAAPAT